MKPVKFRAKAWSGNTVYGYLYEDVGYGDSKYIILEPKTWSSWRVLDEDSISQFVGFDMDGKEVYEGDTVADRDGKKYIVSLTGGVWIEPTRPPLAKLVTTSVFKLSEGCLYEKD